LRCVTNNTTLAAPRLLALYGEDPERTVLGHEHDPARRAVGYGLDDDSGTLTGGAADPELDLAVPDECDPKHGRAGLPVAQSMRRVEAARENPAGVVVAPLVLRAEELDGDAPCFDLDGSARSERVSSQTEGRNQRRGRCRPDCHPPCHERTVASPVERPLSGR